ncbi:protein of unknown function [Candidatus Methylopumilus turicensis]|uniref:Lipoprotein n=1 Tax=Candidatus Methylopumilus turicensis TaxID=1581680 RepID=A0A0B7J0W9_9PROT|nr:protein of unknown function [Candidatus Methylopumilus turicensis]
MRPSKAYHEKNLFWIIVLLTLSGCFEINQPIEILPGEFKSIQKWLTNEDKVT